MNSAVRSSPVSAFPAVQLTEKLLDRLAVSQLGEFQPDFPAAPCQMASSSRRKFGEDTQREDDRGRSRGDGPERDPALGRSQQPLRQVDLISRVIAALNDIGELLVKDPRPAAVAGHPQAVRSLLADRAGGWGRDRTAEKAPGRLAAEDIRSARRARPRRSRAACPAPFQGAEG